MAQKKLGFFNKKKIFIVLQKGTDCAQDIPPPHDLAGEEVTDFFQAE